MHDVNRAVVRRADVPVPVGEVRLRGDVDDVRDNLLVRLLAELLLLDGVSEAIGEVAGVLGVALLR